MTKQGVSVVVCCYNSATRLPDTLRHVAQQKFRQTVDWELVVVDNASTDHTAEQATCLWQQCEAPAPIQIVYEATPGLIAARVAGVQAARYEFISFVDDDNWIAENWIETVFTIFRNHPAVGACGGESIAVFETDPPAWFPKFQSLFAVGQQAQQDGVRHRQYELWGAGLSLRRSAWMKTQQQGFDFLLSGRTGKKLSAGEDSEIGMLFILLGHKLYYSRSLITHHFMPTARLTWDYTKGLLEGQAGARFPLAVYTQLCQGNFMAVRRRSLYWMLFCGKSALATAYGWLRWRLLFKQREGSSYYAKFIFYKSVLKDRNLQQDCRIIEKVYQNYLVTQLGERIVSEPNDR